MSDKSTGKTTGTVRLHRVLKAPPERVYKAFIDPDAMVKWLPPHGFTAKVQHIDATVGGKYHMSFTNFGTGQSHGFGGTFLELTPHQRLRYTDQFDDPSLPGTIQVTIDLKKVMVGTEVNIVQEGAAAADPGRGLLPRLAGVPVAPGSRGGAGDPLRPVAAGTRGAATVRPGASACGPSRGARGPSQFSRVLS